MSFRPLCSFVFLAHAFTVVSAQEMEIRRAIVVDEPAVAQELPEDVAHLPRELPEGAKVYYTRCEVDQPIIAITFDDGPHPEFTPRLLDTLKERQIHATFYMVGRNVTAYPKIVKRMVDEGHEVANHSWSHPSLSGMGTESVRSQLKRTHEAIVKACGVAPLTYRPPYGAIRLQQRGAIQVEFGYPTIIWDVDPLDWKTPRSVKRVHDQVLSQTRNGSIVLLHDIHQTTVDAMPATLDALMERGYKMVTVTQLLQLEAKVDAAKKIQLAAIASEATETAKAETEKPRGEE